MSGRGGAQPAKLVRREAFVTGKEPTVVEAGSAIEEAAAEQILINKTQRRPAGQRIAEALERAAANEAIARKKIGEMGAATPGEMRLRLGAGVTAVFVEPLGFATAREIG